MLVGCTELLHRRHSPHRHRRHPPEPWNLPNHEHLPAQGRPREGQQRLHLSRKKAADELAASEICEPQVTRSFASVRLCNMYAREATAHHAPRCFLNQ
jgi:hypothetical protein